MNRLIIFTDLDGTLLDTSSYSFAHARPAIAAVKEKNIPLVISSSKTKTEIVHYREKLSNHDPFISENGGGIFIPRNYFEKDLHLPGVHITEEEDYLVIPLGAPYPVLRNALKELRDDGFRIRGFGDMTAHDLAKVTGLSTEESAMAKERYFDEPFLFEGTEAEAHMLHRSVLAKGFHLTMGKFFHILGNSDKGKAVSVLIGLYKKYCGDIVTLAVGDNPNDIPMLEKVDYPILVQLPDGTHDERISLPGAIKAQGIGPAGWNKAVLYYLQQLAC